MHFQTMIRGHRRCVVSHSNMAAEYFNYTLVYNNFSIDKYYYHYKFIISNNSFDEFFIFYSIFFKSLGTLLSFESNTNCGWEKKLEKFLNKKIQIPWTTEER